MPLFIVSFIVLVVFYFQLSSVSLIFHVFVLALALGDPVIDVLPTDYICVVKKCEQLLVVYHFPSQRCLFVSKDYSLPFQNSYSLCRLVCQNCDFFYITLTFAFSTFFFGIFLSIITLKHLKDSTHANAIRYLFVSSFKTCYTLFLRWNFEIISVYVTLLL